MALINYLICCRDQKIVVSLHYITNIFNTYFNNYNNLYMSFYKNMLIFFLSISVFLILVLRNLSKKTIRRLFKFISMLVYGYLKYFLIFIIFLRFKNRQIQLSKNYLIKKNKID